MSAAGWEPVSLCLCCGAFLDRGGRDRWGHTACRLEAAGRHWSPDLAPADQLAPPRGVDRARVLAALSRARGPASEPWERWTDCQVVADFEEAPVECPDGP